MLRSLVGSEMCIRDSYQYVRVKGYMRLFTHPAAIFFERGEWPGIAKPETKEIASLSTRPDPDCSFVACAYQIPREEWDPLAEREEEFDFVEVDFDPMDPMAPGLERNVGFMCTASTDDKLRTTSLWDRYVRHLEVAYGEVKVWSWGTESGILPCPVYTRHCVLAVHKEGVPGEVRDSFLDETFLADRVTPIRAHLEAHPEIMVTEPPEEFRERYSG
eukprot:TRINITY_DN51337_c0_g1_i1.p1 TRINITY_DN51337_c0_g1~~TRINITY_DN51337_c0_g1_i1.p1  ORF type:complete len:252 (+),score=65.59 TRINITY_DN51337_c0_g1_i1:108-758(+)